MSPAKKIVTAKKSRKPHTEQKLERFTLPVGKSVMCPVELLQLDLHNPRLQTGSDVAAQSEREVIEALIEIAAIDELITSICTNTYLNLEPLIVLGPDVGPFTVLEGNRRLAAIKLISDPALADELGVRVPAKVSKAVTDSFKEILVNRVKKPEDAREFIGFKHINGPQRWDAYAKAKYVANWYKESGGSISIDEIAAKMGDNNNTLRAYIYAILILEQAEDSGVWSIKDRPPTRGRFSFSHLYTALGREEYQEHLGLTSGWSNKPALKPISKKFLPNLRETLTYLYGSVSDDRLPLIKSQNPDLKDIGLALVNPQARVILKNRGTLDDARDSLKNPSEAFQDALVSANLRMARAISLMLKYEGGDPEIDKIINEIYEQADTLKVMAERKTSRRAKIGN